MSPSAPNAGSIKLKLISTLVFVLGLLAYEGYQLRSTPPETVELYGIYEDLLSFTHHKKKVHYIKIRGLPALVMPVNDDEVITRLRNTRFNSTLKLVLEKSPQKRLLGKPDKYYRAVAIYSNNRIYDFRDDWQARHNKAYKKLLIVMLSLLSLFCLILYKSSKRQTNPKQK